MRVFVLGAGASAHAGYPLMKDLGPELLNWANSTTTELSLGRCALATLGKWKESGRLGNLEAAITDADARAKQIPGWGNIRAGIGVLLSEYFRITLPRSADAYGKLARVAKPGDVVITFNYDFALEIELARAGHWHLRDGYGFNVGSSGPASAVKVLKLHGSANWQASISGAHGSCGQLDLQAATYRPTFSPLACRQLEMNGFEDPEFASGGAMQYMILPSYKKQFFWKTSLGVEGREFWASLWQQAACAIAGCDELVVIGYSLPKQDEAARKLLLEAGKRPAAATICSGAVSKHIAAEFQGAGYSDVRSDSQLFEGWLDCAVCGSV